MLQKWKIILTNWINCYFNETHKKDLPVTFESLLDIISHLRDNLNLDESKSSLLDAHTVQEFMLEKYPEFKFENGSVEPDSESDTYLAASLLLFFVCVNSKNVDIKSAMCSNLSPGDQEIILKFSKHLMNCPKITNQDVLAAITEACEQDLAMPMPPQTPRQVTVAETPPALRSFHSEVRRLQAALDAERFDRTYLQEELTRTNLKVEKLLKDKEQYKLEIVDLKSQISLCCGQDREARREDMEANSTSKLMRQLEEAEQRLINTQEQLEEVQHERDSYKSKFHQLKSEHEKLMTLSQQESSRADSLVEELETERRHTHSLRELVAELRQHNHLNRMDSSLVECDDPDASITSLNHNTSGTSELCVNVIEVQLGEERLKIVALKQQMQVLQEQLCDVTKKAEEEKQTLTGIIVEMKSSIMNLTRRVNEEIEENNTIKTICDSEVAKLNNEINELDQRLKGSQENSRNIIDKKMQEIQNLQEEKLSLLQSLADETTKLENIIKDLQYEVDAEKSSKIKLKEEYDSHIMKLNEKVLNRNNELVELQNKIVHNGETIEHLQLQLRREKELMDELTNKHNNELIQLNSIRLQLEESLQQKSEVARDLHNSLQQHITYITEMNKENDHLKATVSQLQDDCSILKDTKDKFIVEIKNRDVKAEQVYKETENLKNLLLEEKQKLQYNLEETSATVNKLQVQLKNEKVEMQNKLQKSEDQNSSYLKEINKLHADVQKMSKEKEETETIIKNLKDKLVEEKRITDVLKHGLTDANFKVEQLSQEVIENNNIIKDIKAELENNQKVYNENIQKKETIIESIETKMSFENESLKEQVIGLVKEKENLLSILNETENKLQQVELNYKVICIENAEHISSTQILKNNLQESSGKCMQLEHKYNSEIAKLVNRLDETEQSLKEVMEKSNNVIEGKELLLQTLNTRADQMERIHKDMQENLVKSEAEIQSLIQQISKEKSSRIILEKEYLNQSSAINNLTLQFNDEIKKKNEEISTLKKEIQSVSNKIIEKEEEIKLLEWNLTQTSQSLKETTQNKDTEIKLLQQKIMEMEQFYKNVTEELNKEIKMKTQKIENLKAEKKDVCRVMENNNNNRAKELKNKNSVIVNLQQKLDAVFKQLECSQKCIENEQAIWQKCKINMENKILDKDNAIQDLNFQISTLNKIVEDSKRNEALLNEKDILIQELLEEKTNRKILDEEKQALISEKNEIQHQLEKEVGIREFLTQEKESITQQLFEERLSKELAEQEKQQLTQIKKELQTKLEKEVALKTILEQQNCELLGKIDNLNQQIINAQYAEKELNIEKLKLLDENKTFNEVKLSCLTDNEILKHRIKELETQLETLRLQLETNQQEGVSLKNTLNQQIENLINEKVHLTQQISDLGAMQNSMKADCKSLSENNEKLINENKTLNNDLETYKERLVELNQSYLSQLKDKQDEIQRISSDYGLLKSGFKKLEQDVVDVNASLVQYLQNFLEAIKKEEIFNDELRQILDVEKIVEMTVTNKCDVVFKIVRLLAANLAEKYDVNRQLKEENNLLREATKQLEMQIEEMHTEIQNKQQLLEHQKIEISKLQESYISGMESKNRDVQTLQNENQSLHNELNDVKIQLDCKVHSLKDKLIDNENVTDKLKKTYDTQIDNLNMMVNKLTNYLKDKTVEIDSVRKEKDKLHQIVDDNTELIKSLREEIKSIKRDLEKTLTDFESERLVLKNMVTVTESVMEDQKICLNKVISDHLKTIEVLQTEINALNVSFEEEKKNTVILIKEKEYAIETALREMSTINLEKDKLEKKLLSQTQLLTEGINKYKEEIKLKEEEIEKLSDENKELNNLLTDLKIEITTMKEKNNEWKIERDAKEVEFTNEILQLKNELIDKSEVNNKLKYLLEEKIRDCQETQSTIKILKDCISDLDKQKAQLETEKSEYLRKLEDIKSKLEANMQMENNEHAKLQNDKQRLVDLLEDKKSEIIKLESLLMFEKQQIELLQADKNNEKLEYQFKAEQELERRQKEIEFLTEEVKQLSEKCKNSMRDRDENIAQLRQEKDALISKLSKELLEEREKCLKETESKQAALNELRRKLEEVTRSETDTVKLLRKENEILKKTIALNESYAAASQETSGPKSSAQDVAGREQVDNASSDHTHSSLESYKTISDLEKILQDRNRTITSLQSDITYLKSLVADSENKLLDVTRDLEERNENCQQLSSQLKKIVHQKNEEIAELKKQVTKMSVTENRASQIIKVSAKYQAIILKRIAEIKTNTVLKELTNFGNSPNCDNELRRNLTAGSVTMEDLENFLETTDRHLKRCSEKQLALQKERDRLSEVNRINESEIINMKKFLTELTVSVKTFNAVKELYTQKLSRVVSLQRTVRREILGLDERVTDAAMCKLERGYAATMQDLAECAMNMERWVERSVGRAVSAEKIKQAFSSEERSSLSPTTFQNAGLEVQLGELENSFCKLLEEVARAQKGEGAKDEQAVTVMEVRAAYEDKLNRMKAKMKELYHEQIAIFQAKQKEEVVALERELERAREKLEESSRAYEEHIRSLTTELWSVGEKFLMKKDEAEWLRKKRSGSLMSLQHVHSSGLVPTQEEPSRPSEAHSLRSLPVTNNTNNKNEGRGLHMSDEEGEVFDNRCLRELATTPARAPARRGTRDPRDCPPGQRLSELQWRNSLCPPHLKSSYPAETQFTPALHEEDIKQSVGGASMSLGGARAHRKEVGITAYKKPGPPTPSKQAGRLSATDSELRESIRVETEPNASRKAGTPSRIRALFRSAKPDNVEGTPRSRRLSNIFRKK